MKFLVECEFQGQGPPRTQETTKTTGTIRIPRVGFGTDRPYISLFLGPTFPDMQAGKPALPTSPGRLGKKQNKAKLPTSSWRMSREPGSVSTKTHSGDPDGTGGFGGFLGFWSSLALKFGFYKKFHRQNWLEIVGKQDFGPKKGYIGSWWFRWSKKRHHRSNRKTWENL